MGQAIIVGVVIGLLAALELRSRSHRAQEREAQKREQLAAALMYAGVAAAIESLDFVIRADDSKWLASMSETTTLSEAWRDHAEALSGLESTHWSTVNEAVHAVAPSYVLSSAGGRSEIEDLRRSLVERRQLLIEAAEILHGVHHGPKREWSWAPRSPAHPLN